MAPPPSPEKTRPFDRFDTAMGYDAEDAQLDTSISVPVREGPAAIKIKVKVPKPENSVSALDQERGGIDILYRLTWSKHGSPTAIIIWMA